MNSQQWNAQIAEVDKIIPDPVQRAKKIYDILKQHEDLTDWDLVCFSSEFLGLMSMGPLPYLDKVAKEVGKLVYMQHYFHTNEAVTNTPVNKNKLFQDIMKEEGRVDRVVVTKEEEEEKPKLSKVRLV